MTGNTDIFLFYFIIWALALMVWYIWMCKDIEKRIADMVKAEAQEIVGPGVLDIYVGDTLHCHNCGHKFKARRGACVTFCWDCRGICQSYEVGKCDTSVGDPCGGEYADLGDRDYEEAIGEDYDPFAPPDDDRYSIDDDIPPQDEDAEDGLTLDDEED